MHPMIVALKDLDQKLRERRLPDGVHPGQVEEVLGGILGRLDESRGDHAGDIGDIASTLGRWVNVYPSDHLGACHEILVVFSLKSKRWRGQQMPHVKFKDAIQKIINHMNDPAECKGITRYALLVTDTWDPTPVEPFESLLRSMGVDVLLLAPGATSPVLI